MYRSRTKAAPVVSSLYTEHTNMSQQSLPKNCVVVWTRHAHEQDSIVDAGQVSRCIFFALVLIHMKYRHARLEEQF